VGHQLGQVGPLRVLDEPLRGLGLVVHQVADDGLHFLRLVVVVAGHAQGVPGGTVHGLQLCRLFQRLGGGGVAMILELGSGAVEQAVVAVLEVQ